MLALAYHVERLVEKGITSYATVASEMGLGRARMSQIMNLLNLPVPLQEAILLGECRDSERRLRVAETVYWHEFDGETQPG